jgi:hypothetical protein
VREGYFKKLNQFSKCALVQEVKTKKKPTAMSDPDDYPSYVNSSLYSVMQAYSLCTCTPGYRIGKSRHHGRLRLKSEIVKYDDCIAFDM